MAVIGTTINRLAGAALLVAVLGWPPAGHAQEKPDPAKHAQHPAAVKSGGADETLADQVRKLQAQVAKLEVALRRGEQAAPPAPAGGMGMASGGGMGGDKGMAGMMEGMMGGMSPSPTVAGQPMGPAAGGQAMPMADDMAMTGMGAMGKAKGMAGMVVPSALPGFPGASHLYHIGATGFFLDHDGKHIMLTASQKESLNRIKQTSLLTGATALRKIEEAEQDLWMLTAADEPQVQAISAKAKEIEALRSEQRLSFIRTVGEAGKVLTPEQRQQLLGAAGTAAAPTP